MKPIAIIEFPFHLGLRTLDGREPGVNKLPSWLRAFHFHDLLSPIVVERLDEPPYEMEFDEEEVLNTGAVVDYARRQAALLERMLEKKLFPVVIGGDCSIVIGNMLALKKRGKYGLFYLDGHTDFVTPGESGTKAVAGMAAAVVAGRGIERLVNIDGMQPYVEERYVWCVGNREYDDAYEEEIRVSDAVYVRLDELREQGIEQVVKTFLKEVEELDGFWVHVDVDVLDDEVMPVVDSRTIGGLSYEEFGDVLGRLLSSEQMIGIDMTILDPDLDVEGKYAEEFVKRVTAIFRRIRQPS